MLQAFRHLERLRNTLWREQKLQKLHVDIKLGLQQLNSLFFIHLLYISGITDCWVVPANVQTITQKPHLRIYNNTFLQKKKKKKLQHFLKKQEKNLSKKNSLLAELGFYSVSSGCRTIWKPSGLNCNHKCASLHFLSV